MPPSSVVFGLLALPFVPVFAWSAVHPGSPGAFHELAFVGLAASCALRAALPGWPASAGMTAAALLVLAAPWALFWAVDLGGSRFAWTLAIVPVGGLIGALEGRRNAALGVVVALGAVWALMIPRADNGCTGVSGAYGSVQLLHPVLGMWPAPWLFARSSRAVDDS